MAIPPRKDRGAVKGVRIDQVVGLAAGQLGPLDGRERRRPQGSGDQQLPRCEQEVGVRRPRQRVRACAPIHAPPARPACEVKAVVARSARQPCDLNVIQIIDLARAAHEQEVREAEVRVRRLDDAVQQAIAPVDVIVAGAAVEMVVATLAIQHVVARSPADLIVESIAAQGVVQGPANQHLDPSALQGQRQVPIHHLGNVEHRKVHAHRQRRRPGEVERVTAGVCGIFNDGLRSPGGIRVEGVHLVAAAAVEDVVAWPAPEDVVQGVADQRVVAIAAHGVLDGIQEDDGKVRVDHLGARGNQGQVEGRVRHRVGEADGVGAAIAQDRDGPHRRVRLDEEQVVGRAADQGVVARAPDEGDGPGEQAGIQHVGACIPGEAEGLHAANVVGVPRRQHHRRGILPEPVEGLEEEPLQQGGILELHVARGLDAQGVLAKATHHLRRSNPSTDVERVVQRPSYKPCLLDVGQREGAQREGELGVAMPEYRRRRAGGLQLNPRDIPHGHHPVRPMPAIDHVVVEVHPNLIITHASQDRVQAGAARDDVVPELTIQPIGAIHASDVVLARAANRLDGPHAAGIAHVGRAREDGGVPKDDVPVPARVDVVVVGVSTGQRAADVNRGGIDQAAGDLAELQGQDLGRVTIQQGAGVDDAQGNLSYLLAHGEGEQRGQGLEMDTRRSRASDGTYHHRTHLGGITPRHGQPQLAAHHRLRDTIGPVAKLGQARGYRGGGGPNSRVDVRCVGTGVRQHDHPGATSHDDVVVRRVGASGRCREGTPVGKHELHHVLGGGCVIGCRQPLEQVLPVGRDQRVHRVAVAVIKVDHHLAEERFARVLNPVGVQVLPNLARDAAPGGDRRRVNLEDRAGVVDRMQPRRHGPNVRRVRGAVHVGIPIRRGHPMASHHQVVAQSRHDDVVARPAIDGVVRAAATRGLLGLLRQGERQRVPESNGGEGRQADDSLERDFLVVVPGRGLIGATAGEDHEATLIRGLDAGCIDGDRDGAEQHGGGVGARGVRRWRGDHADAICEDLDLDTSEGSLADVPEPIPVGIVEDLAGHGDQVVVQDGDDGEFMSLGDGCPDGVGEGNREGLGQLRGVVAHHVNRKHRRGAGDGRRGGARRERKGAGDGLGAGVVTRRTCGERHDGVLDRDAAGRGGHGGLGHGIPQLHRDGLRGRAPAAAFREGQDAREIDLGDVVIEDLDDGDVGAATNRSARWVAQGQLDRLGPLDRVVRIDGHEGGLHQLVGREGHDLAEDAAIVGARRRSASHRRKHRDGIRASRDAPQGYGNQKQPGGRLLHHVRVVREGHGPRSVVREAHEGVVIHDAHRHVVALVGACNGRNVGAVRTEEVHEEGLDALQGVVRVDLTLGSEVTVHANGHLDDGVTRLERDRAGGVLERVIGGRIIVDAIRATAEDELGGRPGSRVVADSDLLAAGLGKPDLQRDRRGARVALHDVHGIG